MFATLALSANRVVAMDRLIDVVWSDRPPPTAQAQIQKAISALRLMFIDPTDGTDRISTRFPGYVLSASPGEVDIEMFNQEIRLASSVAARGHPAEAAVRFRAALARWFGRALDGVPGLATDATYLEEQRLLALENCIQTELALGRHAELAAELEQLITAHPLRERLRSLHMVALYRCGRQAEALQVYRTARHLLREELGLEPGVELRRVEQAILTGAPADRFSPVPL